MVENTSITLAQVSRFGLYPRAKGKRQGKVGNHHPLQIYRYSSPAPEGVYLHCKSNALPFSPCDVSENAASSLLFCVFSRIFLSYGSALTATTSYLDIGDELM